MTTSIFSKKALFLITLGALVFSLFSYKAGVFYPFLGSTQRKTENLQNKPPILTYFDTARLSDSNSGVKIFTSDVSSGLGVLFVFTLNDTIIDSLLVQNPNIGPPAYKVIKGSTKDYLVVTTIEESGTGYIKEVDSWYRVNQYFHNENKAILSYTSKLGFYGGEKETEETLANYVPSTLTDSSVDIEFVTKKCKKVTIKCHTTDTRKKLYNQKITEVLCFC